MMNVRRKYLFTSESVSDGHPDKLCDAVSDSILDMFLRENEKARVAVETMVSRGRMVVVGETSNSSISSSDIEAEAREVVRSIGYEDESFHWQTMDVSVELQRQSDDIALGVDKDGAGDQGLMFGFACNETDQKMPAALYYCHRIMENLRSLRLSEQGAKLGPDAKVQLTLNYDDGVPFGVHTAVMSSLHHESMSESDLSDILEGVLSMSLPSGWLNGTTNKYFNPTGRFVKGGPACDAGLTGRKIVVDTYGGAAPHGGGAFSGKDSSKVDRSAAYVARYVARNVVAAGLADSCLIQIAYAIGRAEPIAIFVNLQDTEKVEHKIIEQAIKRVIDWRPQGIRERLGLNSPIFAKTSSFGHFGREPLKDGSFSWEKEDLVVDLQRLCS